MKYITGIQALNIENSKNTCGDWHWSGMDWSNLTLAESSDNILDNWGIEGPKEVPDNDELYYVADDMRAILDLMQEGKTRYLIGFSNDFLCTDEYNDEFFSKVLLLKSNKHWDAINKLMEKEFRSLWVEYCIKCGERTLDATVDLDASWQVKHKGLMLDFLLWLNNRSYDYILVGGAALMFCYGLTRFSDSIEFHSFNTNFFMYLDKFICEAQKKYPGIYYIKTNCTDTVKSAKLHFRQSKPLEIRVTYTFVCRPEKATQINNILVYNIEKLMEQIIRDYYLRNKLRDLYDVAFIFNNYRSYMDIELFDDLQAAVHEKGLEQLEYLLKYDNNIGVDNEYIEKEFLKMWYALGLG